MFCGQTVFAELMDFLARGTFLQMAKAESSDQSVLRHVTQRGEDPNLDRHHRLRARRHREETTRPRPQPQRNPPNYQPHAIRENPGSYSVDGLNRPKSRGWSP